MDIAITTPDRVVPVIDGRALARRYREIRRLTETLCAPLAIEDYVVQTMLNVSPTKWHLAHTSWFFETFVLAAAIEHYQPFHPQYGYLFNSYYNAVGERHGQGVRGLLSRPTVEDVYRYRAHVDRRMLDLLDGADPSIPPTGLPVVELGLHHEQQHQELILTDIKHVFAVNPLRPAYRVAAEESEAGRALPSHAWRTYSGGLVWLGREEAGFAFDNERPRHRRFIDAFALGTRLITNGEFLAFIEDGGYTSSEWWLSDGWNTVQANGWEAPLYWERRDGRWWMMTLAGMREAEAAEPVCHVSFYEADAYARWVGARLPSEVEWEVGAGDAAIEGNFVDGGRLHPQALSASDPPGEPRQLFGDVWEWTASAYAPYPGFRLANGALGEYNAKFMCNQMVLRGGSCVTSRVHVRPTYRNFFRPDARWQFTGIRLAKDIR